MDTGEPKQVNSSMIGYSDTTELPQHNCQSHDDSSYVSLKKTKLYFDEKQANPCDQLIDENSNDNQDVESMHEENNSDETSHIKADSSAVSSKQASTESNDTFEMDISQTSIAKSSSSSKDSIKSIVSLKQKHQDDPVESLQQETEGNLLVDETNEIKNDSTNDTLPREDDDNKNPETEVIVQKPTISSIVSETARRLEAAAAAQGNTKLPHRPVAAIRKNHQANLVDTDSTLNPQPKVQSNIVTANINKVNDIKRQLEQSNLKQPVKKSIFWPPRSSSNENDTDPAGENKPADVVPILGRVSANRLSFQRLIEEKNRSSNNTVNNKQPVATRPKPAPPAKPAILVASRFNTADNVNKGQV